MEIVKNSIQGVFEITLKPIADNRGFFMRTYDLQIFNQNGLQTQWVQENHSKSIQKDIIRGLHLQLPPFAETKMIRCIKGEVMDVFVDLRKNSPTFGKWGSVIISESNFKCVYIPKGFAHGFCSLTGNCEVVYKVDNYYNKPSELGIIWNDPDVGIAWPVDKPILSEKDSMNMTLKQFIEKYQFIDVENV